MKRQEKQKALVLRKKGYSLKEISQIVGISKATASVWLRDVSLDAIASSRLARRIELARAKGNQARRHKKELLLETIYRTRSAEVRSIQYSPSVNRLFCALLYWGEGAKRGYDVRLINSDPTLIATFLKLFRSNFTIDERKFRACLQLHSYHDEEKQKRFWSRVTGIPVRQFLKTYQKKNTGLRKRQDYQGCISIRYNDSRMAREIEAIWKSFRDYMGA